MTQVLIDRELLERAVKADASIGASSIALVDGWKAMAQIRAILAQPTQPTVQGEAVEVVGMRIRTDGFGSYIADFAMGVPAAMPGEVREPLMTVAQHQRILAASVSAGCKAVPVELLERAAYLLELCDMDGPTVRELRAILEAKDE